MPTRNRRTPTALDADLLARHERALAAIAERLELHAAAIVRAHARIDELLPGLNRLAEAVGKLTLQVSIETAGDADHGQSEA